MGSGESGPMDLGGAKRSRSPSAASPVAFWLLCRHGQSNSPPAGGEISSADNEPNPNPAPSSVTASPCHLPPEGKAKKDQAAKLLRPHFNSIGGLSNADSPHPLSHP